ncbi:hypothetical protein E3E12_02415 [Formicincola oecophyllae]|uniref:Uncharacterized protein n=1 Tax=Formicincola oecophyllae TaxID=2558361 RepID=A0A4Y6U7W3_9PROT|nr:hypothetical protein E3E12_02415 [Formicincola oecophyllae]
MADNCQSLNCMVSAGGFEPSAPGFFPLRLSPPPGHAVRTTTGVRGLDCLLARFAAFNKPCKGGASPVQSLHLPNLARARLGLARDWHGQFHPWRRTARAFPDFERIHQGLFNPGAQFDRTSQAAGRAVQESCALSC